MVTTVLTGAKRAVCYRRVSSTGQTGERHSSLETQESQYLQYCDSRNYIPIKTFEDVISGRRDDRRDYLRMVDFVKRGGADVVVVQFLDRFGRNPKEILRRYWDLEDHGVSVEATDEDIGEELLLLIKAGIAGAESKRTSERVRSNMARIARKGTHSGRAPFGFRAIRRIDHGRAVVDHWEIDPEQPRVPGVSLKTRFRHYLNLGRMQDRLAAVLRDFHWHRMDEIFLENEETAG